MAGATSLNPLHLTNADITSACLPAVRLRRPATPSRFPLKNRCGYGRTGGTSGAVPATYHYLLCFKLFVSPFPTQQKEIAVLTLLDVLQCSNLVPIKISVCIIDVLFRHFLYIVSQCLQYNAKYVTHTYIRQ